MKYSVIFKILLYNIIILLLLFVLTEVCLYFSFKKTHPNLKYNLSKVDYKESLKFTYPRLPEGLRFSGRPVILAGCSYAYGLYLEGEHTPHYKLAHLTNRPVYNWALPGKGFQHTLYMLQKGLYDVNINNPEYFIYVMMDDHIRRMYSPVMFNDWAAQPVYKIDNHGIVTLKSESYPVYKKFFTYYYIYNLLYFSVLNKNYYANQSKCFAYFREINRQIKKIYPEIKFVILLYDDHHKFAFDFSQLEREGFIVFQTKELTGENLQTDERYIVSKSDTHPTEAAWDVILPVLIKKLNL